MIWLKIFSVIANCFLSWALAGAAGDSMVVVPAGTYVPFYPDKKAEGPRAVKVAQFFLDAYPVTRADFLAFVKAHPEWRKSQAKGVFSDKHYLENWKGDFKFSGSGKTPVTFVSWFAAKAYCESVGKALPTLDQWEYAAADNGRMEKEIKERVLEWYSKPNTKLLAKVGSTPKNGFGVYDLQGLIWEWVYDFNSPSGGDPNSFCGAGAGTAKDSSDYVNYMRFAFRNSLKASYTTANLGFRCAKDVTP